MAGYPATMADMAPAVPHGCGMTHALVVIPHALPLFYTPHLCPPPPQKKDRMVDLQRSVLNLVDSHDHLALTDPELLHWYLSLCLKDRKIIQDQGGLRNFLRRHPGLYLFQDSLFVKYKCEKPSSAVTSSPNRTVGRRASCECVDGAPCVFGLCCTMFPQHSWRLFYSSAEGSRNVTTPEDPAAPILHTLHQLDSDYNHMKQQMLAAVPLEFSVPSAYCVPVQGISDGLPPASSWSPEDPQMLMGAAEAQCEEDYSSQLNERTVETSHLGGRADAPQSRGFRPDEVQTVVCDDGIELWYDAEDELQLPGAPSEPAGSAGTPPLQGCGSGHADSNTGSTGGKSSVQFVSNQSKEAIQLLAPPTTSSSRSGADVFMSLDAKQTFVSHTWGTMGSVCTLTAQLQRLHPNASRASIMAALTVLRARQKGPLLSLPLESIRAMTSDLLSRQSSD
ncbi:RNA-binding protein 44 isoform X2 [Oryzias melastigma]|uniref:RNA-binding protein 44 isoform X2 n=1 Tax=Oryzias melastigma TaxID=30732 RepID=UPI000CF7E9B4|nr:RNA-binding protein 44 isoform X2 [Oryzias melastigma]